MLHSLLVFLFGIPHALAASGIAPDRPLTGNVPATASEAIGNTYEAIKTILLLVAGGLAVLYVIWGGVRYITAAGSADKAKAARSSIINALIGLVIVMLAYLIVAFAQSVGNLVGSGNVLQAAGATTTGTGTTP